MLQLFPMVVAATLAVSTAAASTAELNGWYPCSTWTFASETPAPASSNAGSGGSSNTAAECATFKAPLCHDGICKSHKQIDIFTKRIATAGEDKPNVIFLQGGPGDDSTSMESILDNFHAMMGEAVNVYTIDHRGTGRSTYLDCVAVQAETTGSPNGVRIHPSEIANCATDLAKRYDAGMEAFSITSAANDIKLFISGVLGANSPTYVYGVSYATSLVERLMHLNPPGVVGYILDGVSTSSGSKFGPGYLYSQWDIGHNDVGQYVLSFCAKDQANCGKFFNGTTANDALRKLLTDLESPSFKCSSSVAKLLSPLDPKSASPGLALRGFLGDLLEDEGLRKTIPVVVHRLSRCNDDDVKVFGHFVSQYNAYANSPSESGPYISWLVYDIIKYAEMWETPTLSVDQMIARLKNCTVGGSTYDDEATYQAVRLHCLFTKEASPGCRQFAKEASFSAPALTYKRDQFWNKAANLPPTASVLLLSSKMDSQTPHVNAERLYDVLGTKNKKLVTFEYATHAAIASTSLPSKPEGPTCGMSIISSYVAAKGDVSKVDTSCVAQLPVFSFALGNGAAARYWFNTADAYDGSFLSESTKISTSTSVQSDNVGTTSYETPFIVSTLFCALAVVAAVALFVKLRKAEKATGVAQTSFKATV